MFESAVFNRQSRDHRNRHCSQMNALAQQAAAPISLLDASKNPPGLASMSAKNTGDDEGGCCRICLDPLAEVDLTSGRAIRLGCRCSASGYDLMHRDCASQWFGDVRRSSVCEVCSAEAVGLPADVKGQIRRLAASSPAQPQTPTHRLLGFSSVPSFLGCYAVFCLLPATLVSLAFALFFIRAMSVGMLVGAGLSAGLASVTIVHWIFFCKRPVVHSLFIASMVSSAMAFTVLADMLFTSWSANMKAISGSLVGMFIGVVLFHSLLAMLLAVTNHPRGSGSNSPYSTCFLYCSHFACCWQRQAHVPPLGSGSAPVTGTRPGAGVSSSMQREAQPAGFNPVLGSSQLSVISASVLPSPNWDATASALLVSTSGVSGMHGTQTTAAGTASGAFALSRSTSLGPASTASPASRLARSQHQQHQQLCGYDRHVHIVESAV